MSLVNYVIKCVYESQVNYVITCVFESGKICDERYVRAR